MVESLEVPLAWVNRVLAGSLGLNDDASNGIYMSLIWILASDHTLFVLIYSVMVANFLSEQKPGG